MKKLNQTIMLMSLVLLFSCGQGGQQMVSTEERTDDEMFIDEKMSFEIESIPKEFNVEYFDNDNKTSTKKLDKKDLGLPSSFVNRYFLDNVVGYKDKLDYLVGMVVKKVKVNGVEEYHVIKDFKIDSAKVNARIPADGILVEKNYDSKIGSGIKYLVAEAKFERNSAIQVLINDVSEITIEDKLINQKALSDTYSKDAELDSYFIIRAAVTTSIMHKKYTKTSIDLGFDASAIKVNGNYYSQNSDLKQDWKIGMNLVSVKEFLKGYKP